MNNRISVLTAVVFILSFNSAEAQKNQWSSARPDGHAPISVMGDHYHKKNELMFSYRYMPMWMAGNLQSTDEISDEEIYQNFTVAPQNMQMNMHMLDVMYAPSDNLTLMVMVNYISNSMELRTDTDIDFTAESGGFGDITLSGLVKIINSNRQALHGNIGISIPTADIEHHHDTTVLYNTHLACPMQLGSGTWDPIIGLTYLGQSEKISWGAQTMYKFRLGENSENYTFGNRFDIVAWGAVKVSDYFSFSASLSYFNTQKIDGVDSDLHSMMMPLVNIANSGRSQFDFGLGTNFYLSKGRLKNLRLAAEVKIPAFQKVNGIQMKNSLMAILGIQYTIGLKE